MSFSRAMAETSNYTCNDYRLEMILLSLRRRLSKEDMSESEKDSIRKEIRRIEAEMGMG